MTEQRSSQGVSTQRDGDVVNSRTGRQLATGKSSTAGSQKVTSATLQPTKISADPDAGFNFPYYLYAPSDTRDEPILVETVNTGGSGTQTEAIGAAKSLTSVGIARTVSDDLRVPLLAPAFPNPTSDGFRDKFIQSLDTETMQIDSGEYERIDLQLLNMVDDARSRLTDYGIQAPKEFMMNGFSASGDFVNNFVVMHPDRIASATAGAVNGMGTLPLSQANGEVVNYQIGVADLADIIGEPFDETAWTNAPQFCYMGANERSPWDDTLPYRDVWSQEQADKARRVYGSNMQQERMVDSERVYREAGATARYEIYDGKGHEYTREIFQDILTFHRRHNGLPTLRPLAGHTAGSTTVTVDIVLPGTQDTFEARAFVDGTEASVEPVTVIGSTSNRVTLELGNPLKLGETLAVGVFEPGNSALSNAVRSDEWPITMRAEVVSTPKPGDTAIEVSYGLSSAAGSSMDLYLLTDNGAVEWQRERTLASVSPDESGSQTFQLDTKTDGIPFQNGDDLEIGFTPGRDWKATPTETATVGSDGAFAPDSCTTFATATDDQVEVSIANRPTLGDDSLTISYSVDSAFRTNVSLKLFPDTGAGRYGLESWDSDYARPQPGDSGTEEYNFPTSVFTPTDTPALGETVELRAYPDGWSDMTEFVASDCAIITGIRFAEPPEAGEEEVVIEYMYPEGTQHTGEIQLTVDGQQVATMDGIDPGTMNQHAFSVPDGGIPSNATVSVLLLDGAGDTVDTDSETALVEGAGNVSFAEPPIDGEETVSIAYQLDADHTDQAMVRLYTPDGSDWGVYLDQVSPGESKTRTISLPSDEPAVPFKTGQQVSLALVDTEDPYRIRPLATATDTTAADRDSAGEVAVTASGDVIPVDGEATVTVDAKNTAEIVVDGLWSDWSVTNTETAGSQFNRDGRRAVFSYESPTSAIPTLTLQPNATTDQYVGGDYLLAIEGRDGEAVATDSTTLTIDPTLEAVFTFQNLVAEDVVPAGDELSTTATVENIGGIAGSASVTFSVDTESSQADVTDLQPEERASLSATLDTTAISQGRYDLLAELDSETTSRIVDVFETDSAGLYGSMTSADGVALGDTPVRFSGYDADTGTFASESQTVDEDNHFVVSQLLTPDYTLGVFVRKDQFGQFDGFPALIEWIQNYTVTADTEVLGRYTLPRGYRTEVQLLDRTGEPIPDFSPVNFRTEGGRALGPSRFTTDQNGYVIADRNGVETGISVPQQGIEDLRVVADPADDQEPEEEFGTIYGSPSGEEFTFEVQDPSRF